MYFKQNPVVSKTVCYRLGTIKDEPNRTLKSVFFPRWRMNRPMYQIGRYCPSPCPVSASLWPLRRPSKQNDGTSGYTVQGQHYRQKVTMVHL